MCDNDSMDDMIKYQLKSGELSRRQFGALTLGAGVLSLLPPVANAAEIKEQEVEIKTPDGTCDAYFVHPAIGRGAGRAGVAGHLRPAPRVPADGQAPRRVRLCRAGRESVLPRAEGADGARARELRGPGRRATSCSALAGTLTPADATSPMRRPSSPGSTASRRRQEAQDRHHRLLHGRPDRDAHGGRAARIASAPARPSTAAASSPTSRTARTCWCRR